MVPRLTHLQDPIDPIDRPISTPMSSLELDQQRETSCTPLAKRHKRQAAGPPPARSRKVIRGPEAIEALGANIGGLFEKLVSSLEPPASPATPAPARDTIREDRKAAIEYIESNVWNLVEDEKATVISRLVADPAKVQTLLDMSEGPVKACLLRQWAR